MEKNKTKKDSLVYFFCLKKQKETKAAEA